MLYLCVGLGRVDVLSGPELGSPKSHDQLAVPVEVFLKLTCVPTGCVEFESWN